MLKLRKLPILAVGFALILIAAACGGSAAPANEVADTAPPVDAPVAEPSSTTTTETPSDETDDDEQTDHDDDEDATDDDDGTSGSDPDDDANEPVDSDRTVDVVMTDFAFEPNLFTAAAGETVTYNVTNIGLIEHEFRLSNAHRIEEHLADDDHGGDDDDGHEEGIDEVLYLAAGDSGQITVTFPEDTTIFTEVACLIPGHYEAGMFAGLSYNA